MLIPILGILLIVLAGIGPSSDVSGKVSVGKCQVEYSAKHIKKFADTVWAKHKWERGMPTRQIRKAYKSMLSCAKGPGHRKAAKKYWKQEKQDYFHHRAYKLRWGNCKDAGPVPDCIHGAALTYGADESWMMNVSMCESTWNRYAQNPSGSSGLFQFLPSTWTTTPYGSKDIWSVKWQSLAAAWMYVQGRSGEWVCSG